MKNTINPIMMVLDDSPVPVPVVVVVVVTKPTPGWNTVPPLLTTPTPLFTTAVLPLNAHQTAMMMRMKMMNTTIQTHSDIGAFSSGDIAHTRTGANTDENESDKPLGLSDVCKPR